jgi:hypothetical protein
MVFSGLREASGSQLFIRHNLAIAEEQNIYVISALGALQGSTWTRLSIFLSAACS